MPASDKAFLSLLLPFLDKKDFDWLSILRKPLFIPENKKLDDLMQEFQEKKIHLAIVVDEFGGTSGVISLEDVIEEIVGDLILIVLDNHEPLKKIGIDQDKILST
mgnify:CR=1 FL=1